MIPRDCYLDFQIYFWASIIFVYVLVRMKIFSFSIYITSRLLINVWETKIWISFASDEI